MATEGARPYPALGDRRLSGTSFLPERLSVRCVGAALYSVDIMEGALHGSGALDSPSL